MSHGWNKCIECGQHYHEAEEVRGGCPLCAKKKHKIKPTIWWDKEFQDWVCTDINHSGNGLIEASEDYCKHNAFGCADSPAKAYESWLKNVQDTYNKYQRLTTSKEKPLK